MLLLTTIFLSFLWGGSFVAIKYVLADLPPLFSGFLRLFIGLITIFPLFAINLKKYPTSNFVTLRLLRNGVFSTGFPFVFLFLGMKGVNAGFGGLMNATVPIWTCFFSYLFGRTEKINTYQKCGVLLGFLSIGLIFLPKINFNQILNQDFVSSLLVMGMAVSYGIGNILNRRLFIHHKINSIVSTFYQFCSGALLLFISAVAFEWTRFPDMHFSTASIVGSIYMGSISTGFAFILYFKLINDFGALKASSVTYLIPIFSIILGYLFFQEKIASEQMAGMALSFVSIYLIQNQR